MNHIEGDRPFPEMDGFGRAIRRLTREANNEDMD
jgi:hypothetical protein